MGATPFADDQGQTIPGYMTTGELIAEIDAGPVDPDRYALLANEAVYRAGLRAFPRHRIAALAQFATGSYSLPG
jgi:hypothetical protein